MLISNHLVQYKDAIRLLPKDRTLERDDLLAEDFLMSRSGKLEVYYAPHNEYLNPYAKVMVIGLTPGFTQMRIALREAQSAMEAGLTDEEICRKAQEAARFAGSMKTNLIDMLNAIDLHRQLNLPSCRDLFHEHQPLLHTTSLLRFPVFIRKKNYSGANPNLLSNPMLREAALTYVLEEIEMVSDALIIPLGKTVEGVLDYLVQAEKLGADRCLWGFPHPSGANGHRHKQFADHQDDMRRKIQNVVNP